MDQGLTARILRLVNSLFYALRSWRGPVFALRVEKPHS